MTVDMLQELCDWLISQKAVDPKTISADLPGIKRLDLSGRALEHLPEQIGVLTGLIALNLSNNRLSDLPKSMAEMQALMNLDIRRNAFQAIPACIGKLQIKSLNAGGNRIGRIDALADCDELRVLDLNGNELTEVGSVFGRLHALRNLNLSFNYLSQRTGMFRGLENLEILVLNENLFEVLDTAFSDLVSLERLEISSNRIRTIEEVFYDLPLEYLDLSSNELGPLHLKKLQQLETLILDDNNLSSATIDDAFAPYLVSLSCEGCHLERCLLPSSTHIEMLCFSSNSLREIPGALVRYKTLRELDLDNNEIVDLPDIFSTFEALETLYIDSNPLSEKAQSIIGALEFGTSDLQIKREIVLRKAQLDDLQVMARLISQLFAIESDFSIDYEKQYAGLKLLYEQNIADMLVAKHRNAVIGMVTMQRLVSSAEGGYVGLVEDLIVDEAYRRMGVGHRLISEIKTIARKRGYLRIQLAADKENAKALYFYRKRGFCKTNLTMYHLRGLQGD